MIPLIKPRLPSLREVGKYYKLSREAGQYSNFGPCYTRLANILEQIFDQETVLVTNSGTSALRLGVQVNVPRGTKVLIPDFTHIGTLNAVLGAGCVPVLGPVHRDTWALDTDFAYKNRDQFDAIVAVIPFGYNVNLDPIKSLADDLKMPLIVDAAGAFPTTYDADTVCYSAHATKSLAVGEAGFVVFKNSDHKELAFSLSQFALAPDRMVLSPYGDNLKPSELTCATFLAALMNFQKEYSGLFRKRRATASTYMHYLRGCGANAELHLRSGSALSLIVLGGMNGKKIEALSPHYGFVSRRYYIPLSTMPGLQSVKRIGVSEKFFSSTVALPRDVTEKEMEKVIHGVRTICESG